MAEEKEILGTVRFAAKWWADRIAGDESAVFVSNNLQDELDELHRMDPNAWEFMNEHVEDAMKQTQEKLKARLIEPEIKERFQTTLEFLIMKDLEEGHESYLFVDHDGTLGTLGKAAQYCCIEIGDDSVFAYFVPTEMFVGKELVEARFTERDYYHVLYDDNLEKTKKVNFPNPANGGEKKRKNIN